MNFSGKIPNRFFMRMAIITAVVFFVSMVTSVGLLSCEKPITDPPMPELEDTIPTVVIPFDINSIRDDYSDLAAADKVYQWGSHNVHDPSILFDGQYYYCYSTDAAYGVSIKPGIQIRRSKDLIDWQFIGWVFSDVPEQAASYIRQQGGVPNRGLWAPYALKVGKEFRLYYSLSSTPKPRLSTIGLATAPTAVGPWTPRALVVSSTDDATTQTNAIDPSVLVDTASGRQFLYYGSAWDGIYMLELDPVTGLAQKGGSRGRRIAQRGFTKGVPNGNIEGAEIIYNPEFQKYYLFISYDWLQTKYNVRVGRADTPEGPFLDIHGEDINLEKDHAPMALAPYKFNDHAGFQGVAHCAVFNQNETFFIAHQARPAFNSFFMNLHVRTLLWTPNGWPVASPERYAAISQVPAIVASELEGAWEYIDFNYRIVPGYDKEQISPDMQTSVRLVLEKDGFVGTSSEAKWSLADDLLTIIWSDNRKDLLRVARGWDWEKKQNTLVFAGLNPNGYPVWGKKI
ncbi:MAG: arabinan endo-1,5-alpha-L-arabinosidase [Haliscomenobacter sp.]